LLARVSSLCLESLAAGNDPLGASQILSCVKTARAQLRLLASLRSPKTKVLQTLARSIRAVARERAAARQYILALAADVQTTNLDAARSDLSGAQAHLQALSALLASAQQGLAQFTS